jgi:hypothetical protein
LPAGELVAEDEEAALACAADAPDASASASESPELVGADGFCPVRNATAAASSSAPRCADFSCG